jgi:small subunit ribosomal protein S17
MSTGTIHMNEQKEKREQSIKGKRFIGKVVSMSTAKTVKVEVSHMRKHPLYKKSLRRTKRFMCHAENADIKVGDTVEICQIRPISRTKHFSIVRKIEHGRNV